MGGKKNSPRGGATGAGYNPVQNILDRLPDARPFANGYTAKCPAHDDQTASLSVGIGDDGRALLKCFAGCSAASICGALGLSVADLFPRGGTLFEPAARHNGRTPKPPAVDFAALSLRFTRSVEPEMVEAFAKSLGVDAGSLRRLGVGWDGSCWCFPMRGAASTIVGVQRRLGDGKKLCVPGSRLGLFIPTEASPNGTLFVAEGASDAAALLTLGLDAIGRASCAGGVELCKQFCKGRSVVIFADADEPGRKGANTLARALVDVCQNVRTIEPPEPHKDVRQWAAAGGTAADVQKLACKAEPLVRETMDEFRVVRGEMFNLRDVSGLLATVPTLRDGKPAAEWVLYLRWHETGKREKREIGLPLELPGGTQVYFHPWPGKPSLVVRSGWTLKSRKSWLAGEDAPNPADVFRRTCELFAHFLHFAPDVAAGSVAALACWAMLSYVYSCWPSLPYLSISGPLGSGKSTLFRVLGRLCFRPLESSNMTAACLFRTLHECGGTLLLDEAEKLRDKAPEAGELRSILLSGYRQGSPAMRLEKVGNGFARTAFDVFGPKAFGAIARLPEALSSRCIRIGMFRAEPSSPKPRRRLSEKDAEFRELRNELHVLSLEHGRTWLELVGHTDVVPDTFAGRDFELWQPLLAIGSWLEEHGVAGLVAVLTAFAEQCIDGSIDDNLSDADIAVLTILAEHVRGATVDSLRAGDILAAACERYPTIFGPPDKPRWSAKGVSNALRRYGLTTKKFHGTRTYRNVTEEQLQDVSRAYGFELPL